MVYLGRMAETQMCLACSVNPAAPGSGTVPLCASCKSLASDNKRGVRYTPDPVPPPPKPES